jgi:hypothetical protein
MPFHQQLLYNAMELITGFNAMLTTGQPIWENLLASKPIGR